MTEEQKENNRRKRFVRRIYKKTSLWCVTIVKQRYPDYDSSMLCDDLKIKYKRKKLSVKQVKGPVDFRSCQIKKYLELMEISGSETADFHRACIMASRLNEAHIKKRDIFLSICINKKTIRYGFKWNSSEKFIKEVAEISGSCLTHEDFEEKINQMTMSI